jgi:hypothetical protein
MHENNSYQGEDRNLAEVEAETFAFLLCKPAGLDTASYSFGYLASWSNFDADRFFELAQGAVDAANKTHRKYLKVIPVDGPAVEVVRVLSSQRSSRDLARSRSRER